MCEYLAGTMADNFTLTVSSNTTPSLPGQTVIGGGWSVIPHRSSHRKFTPDDLEQDAAAGTSLALIVIQTGTHHTHLTVMASVSHPDRPPHPRSTESLRRPTHPAAGEQAAGHEVRNHSSWQTPKHASDQIPLCPTATGGHGIE